MLSGGYFFIFFTNGKVAEVLRKNSGVAAIARIGLIQRDLALRLLGAVLASADVALLCALHSSRLVFLDVCLERVWDVV